MLPSADDVTIYDVLLRQWLFGIKQSVDASFPINRKGKI